MACVMYADDLLLLSVSVTGLQKLIDICVSSSKDLCLAFNENKSYCIVVGPRNYDKLADVCVDGNALKWTNSIRYLGVDIKSENVFSVNWEQVRKKFFVALNSVLSNGSDASDLMKLYLCESNCLPLSTCVIESLDPSKKTLRKLNVY